MQQTTDLTVRDDAPRDDGFTLVELLIVIVILGILATVTVFAVRGITDKGQTNAEGTDLTTLETAIDAYWMDNSTNPTETQLVTAGFLKGESDLHDIVVAADGSYTITNVRTGATVATGQAGSGTPATTVTPVNAWLGTPTTVGGFPAVSYGNPSAPPFERAVFIAGDTTKVGWNAKVAADAGLNSSWTNVTVIDIGQVTDATTADNIVLAARSTAFYVAVSVSDDVAIAMGGQPSVLAYYRYGSGQHPNRWGGGLAPLFN